MKEKELEQQCVLYARAHGWDAWKNENNGNKGIPDHSLLKRDVFLMVEFKRPDGGGRISKEQLLWKNRHPHTVHFCNSLDNFKEILDCYEKGGGND